MMTMDDFEFGVPTEEMAALPEGFPEAGLDVPGPAEDGADALIPQPPADGDGQGGAEAESSLEEPPAEDAAPVAGLPEADQLDPEAGNSSSDTPDVMGLAAQENAAPMDEPPVGDSEPARQSAPQRPERAAPRPKAGSPAR